VTMQPSEKPKEVEAVVLKSFLDMPPLEARPSIEARVAKLEAKVEALEAALAKVPPKEYGGWQTVAELYDFEPGASSGELVLRDKKK
jgi:hypothetical protein